MSEFTDVIQQIVFGPAPLPEGDIPPQPLAPPVPPPPLGATGAAIPSDTKPALISGNAMLGRYTALIEKPTAHLDSRKIAILSNLVHAQLLLEDKKDAALILAQQVQQSAVKMVRLLLKTIYLEQAVLYKHKGDTTRAKLAKEMAEIYQK